MLMLRSAEESEVHWALLMMIYRYFCGRIMREKGVLELLQAISEIDDQHVELMIVAVLTSVHPIGLPM